MTQYEELLKQASRSNVTVLEKHDLTGTRLKGLYCDNFIALSSDLDTETEKSCILAEELGHYHTTTGNILDQSNPDNLKQERKARLWAYNKMIGLTGIINAFNAKCRNRYEVAEYLNVTEEFLTEALKCYKEKYGICAEVDNYTIYFEPCLGVVENM